MHKAVIYRVFFTVADECFLRLLTRKGTVFVDQAEPSYASQSKYLAYINLPKAWTKGGKGRSSQIISIVDSGRFETAGDLTNHWVNLGDPAPGDGIDNDGNGYIDDFKGWNAVSNNNNASEPGIYSSSNNVYFSHGSAVWTTAAAPENNYGIVGVAPASSVVFVKAGRMEGNNVYFYPDDLVAAMDYLYVLVAIRNVDIRVQVASYGGPGYSSILESAINEAIGSKVLFVTSAGNYNSNVDTNPIYPCSFSLNAKLCVGAVDLSGVRSSYSNYGMGVDLSAPGTVVAPVKRPNGQETLAAVSGTSFSCPLVAGAAEILANAYPTLTPVRIAQCLKSSSRKTGKYLGTSSNGVLDVLAALNMCAPRPPPSRRPNDVGDGSIFTLLPLLLLQ